MRQTGLVVCFLAVGLSIGVRPAYCQNFDASANGGLGVAERSGFGIPGVPTGGGSIGWAIAPAHKLQFDYAFGRIERNLTHYNRHFFTGSYVLQLRQGRTRPFLQFGAGVQYETNDVNRVINRDLYYSSRTAFAGVIGGGVTVELGRGAFIRPQFRTYLAPGPTHTINVTALPSLGLGWRF